jgi:hypothetical protein
MRSFLFATLSAVTLLFAPGATTAAGVVQDRYCLQGRQWGYPGNCHFSTYEQCMATASGTGANCGINPVHAHHHRGYRQSH